MSRSNLFDLSLVLAIGVGLLALAYLSGFLRMSIPDEFIYAAMGRNIADFKGIYTNFYVPDALMADGYPTGDTHMPGYSLILAGSFWLFGPHEFAAFLPGQLAFILSELAIFWVGQTIFNRRTGLWAAIWLGVLPIYFIWINAVLPETILVLLSVLFSGVWYRAVNAPQPRYGFWLALLLILGMLCRETFVIFLPPALYALWRWPRSTRTAAWLIFGAVFLIGMVFVFQPLNAARASYPWQAGGIIEEENQPDLVRTWAATQDHLKKNLETELELAWEPFSLSYLSKYIVTLLVVASFWIFEKKLWHLLLYYLLTFLPSLLIMLIFYDTFRWFGGLRIFVMLMPAGIVVACGALSRLPLKLQYGACVLVAVSFLSVSLWANYQMRDIRHQKFEKQLMMTNTLTQQLAGLPKPDVVLIEDAFMYGWQNYPVTVIWDPTNNLGKWQVMNKRLQIDLIATQDSEAPDKLLQAMAQGLVSNDFILLNQTSKNDYYIFVHR